MNSPNEQLVDHGALDEMRQRIGTAADEFQASFEKLVKNSVNMTGQGQTVQAFKDHMESSFKPKASGMTNTLNDLRTAVGTVQEIHTNIDDGGKAAYA